MNIWNDERVVMTLDAGGTNFVFSAVQAGNEIISPITFASNAHDLQQCLRTMIKGFETIKEQLPSAPAAITSAMS